MGGAGCNEDPLSPLTSCGRPVAILAKSAWDSGCLAGGQRPLGWERLRCAAAGAFGHPFGSPGAAGAAPFTGGLELTTVEVEDVDELEAIDDDELFLCRLFRGMRIRLSSSEFMIWPV